jgi:hypothetical protein
MRGAATVALVVVVAIALKPLLSPREVVDLEKIKEWGLKGPFTVGNPVLGVFMFKGLTPSASLAAHSAGLCC